MTGDHPKSTDSSGATQSRNINGMAVASLVLGVAWLMWIGSILALVFGYTARRQIDRSPDTQTGAGLAVAGIVLGWVGIGSLILMVTMTMTGAFNMPEMPMMNRWATGNEFTSNGERIYMTATSDLGGPITYEDGPAGGMMSGGLACVDCHGDDGRGGERQMMMEAFHAPDIRWTTLTGDHSDHGDEEGGDHPSYTTESLRAAITRGEGVGGRQLDPVMPRWELSREDLADLIQHLETLGNE